MNRDYIRELDRIIVSVKESAGMDSRFSPHWISEGDGPVELRGEKILWEELIREIKGFELTGENSGSARLDNESGIDIAFSCLNIKDNALLVVNTGSVNVRKRPSAGSELLTQALIGERMKLFCRHGGWLLLRMEDGYCGWVEDQGVININQRDMKNYRENINSMVTARTAPVYSEPDDESCIDDELTAGSRIAAVRAGDRFLRVIFPSGTEGFIEGNSAEAIKRDHPGPAGILQRAAGFMGIPYLWGGTTSRGFDCSGLVKRVFDMEGVALPRDSDLQAEEVPSIELNEAIESRPGSLLFFGRDDRISHVAISAGGGNFIHCSGKVRMDSFNRVGCELSRGDLRGAGAIFSE